MPRLTPIMEKFILHWGEMGTRWGINRTVAQIHALLYLAEKPLHAEEIAETLSVARSNVSNSLRELQNWGIVKIVHVIGDRRDHFESMKDVWAMFQTIISERKRREIDPTLTMLRDCVAAAQDGERADSMIRQRLEKMLDFMETMVSCYEQIIKMPPAALGRLAKLSSAMPHLPAVTSD